MTEFVKFVLHYIYFRLSPAMATGTGLLLRTASSRFKARSISSSCLLHPAGETPWSSDSVQAGQQSTVQSLHGLFTLVQSVESIQQNYTCGKKWPLWQRTQKAVKAAHHTSQESLAPHLLLARRSKPGIPATIRTSVFKTVRILCLVILSCDWF